MQYDYDDNDDAKNDVCNYADGDNHQNDDHNNDDDDYEWHSVWGCRTMRIILEPCTMIMMIMMMPRTMFVIMMIIITKMMMITMMMIMNGALSEVAGQREYVGHHAIW